MNGGTVSNVVPEDAYAEVDVRVMQPGEWEQLKIGNAIPHLCFGWNEVDDHSRS